jgi:hypothetical protein
MKEAAGHPYQLETLEITAEHGMGNPGVATGVSGSDGEGIGFVEYGFAGAGSGLEIICLADSKGTVEVADIPDAAADLDMDGARALYYITIGQPTGLAKLFIDYCRLPENNMEICSKAGLFSFY